MKLFVTYGFGYHLANCYSEVEGTSLEDCRRHVDLVTRGKYAFTYTAEQFKGQVEKYGLKKVDLQPQRKVEEES